MTVPVPANLPKAPPPRFKVVNTGRGQATLRPDLPVDGSADLAEWEGRYLAAFGGVTHEVADQLFSDLISVLHANPHEPASEAMVNTAMALIADIGPESALEAALAVQMVAVHLGTLETARRGLSASQSAAGRQQYLALSGKLARTFALQMDTLNRGRGKGVVQTVRVEKVVVRDGGQAVVGAVASGKERGGG